MSGQRGLLAVIAGIVVLLVGSVAVILIAGDRPPRDYPAGSPEAAFQAYLVAWEQGDFEVTYAAFSPEAQAEIPYADYRQQAADFRRYNTVGQGGPSRRVFIDRVTLNGERALLDLTVEETWVSGLNTSRNTYDRQIAMDHSSGSWLIDEMLMGLEPSYFGKY